MRNTIFYLVLTQHLYFWLFDSGLLFPRMLQFRMVHKYIVVKKQCSICTWLAADIHFTGPLMADIMAYFITHMSRMQHFYEDFNIALQQSCRTPAITLVAAIMAPFLFHPSIELSSLSFKYSGLLLLYLFQLKQIHRSGCSIVQLRTIQSPSDVLVCVKQTL